MATENTESSIELGDIVDYLYGRASGQIKQMIELRRKQGDEDLEWDLQFMASQIGLSPEERVGLDADNQDEHVSTAPPLDCPFPSATGPAPLPLQGTALTGAVSRSGAVLEQGSGQQKHDQSPQTPGHSPSVQFPSVSNARKRHAIRGVLVGVDFYAKADPGFALPLSCAVHDVESACRVFGLSHANTHLRTLLNLDATVDNVRRATRNVASCLTSDDTFLFMFCGHGWRLNRNDRLEAAFLTSEFRNFEVKKDGGLPVGVFTVEDIKHWLGDAVPKNILVLLDSCYSSASLPVERQHDPVAATFDEHGAVPRSVATSLDDSTHEEVLLDPKRREWPPKSNVAVLSSATEWQLAYEVPAVGHGVFTLLVLEWWQNVLATTAADIPDVGHDLATYIEHHVSRLHTYLDLGPQGVNLTTSGHDFQNKVCFDDDDNWNADQPSPNWITISRDLRSAGVYDAWSHYPKGEERYNTYGQDRETICGAVVGGPDRLQSSNVVVSIPRLYGSQALMKEVTERLELELVGRPVLYVEMVYFQDVLPLIISLGLYAESYQGHYPRAAQPPLLDQEDNLTGFSRETIDFFVQSLKDCRAVVVAFYRQQDSVQLRRGAFDALYFLRKCATTDDIRLCVAHYADERTPSFLNDTDYRLLALRPLDVNVLKDYANKHVNVDSIDEALRSWRLLDWLKVLDQRELTRTQLRPYREGRNVVRTYVNVVNDVIEQMEHSTHGPAAVRLLALMCVMDLPRNWELIEEFWNQLIHARHVDVTRTTLQQAVDTLKEYYLVAIVDGNNDSGDGDKSLRPTHVLVHYIVREAVGEYRLRLNLKHVEELDTTVEASTGDYLEKQQRHLLELTGRSFGRLLEQGYCDAILRTEIIAYEAIDHLCRARRYDDATELLNEQWGKLLDFGYYRAMLDWCNQCRGKTSPTREIRLLARQMSLYKHLQQWEMIPGLVGEIEKRLFEPGHSRTHRTIRPECRHLKDLYQSVQRQHANYYWLQNDFKRARQLYDKCMKLVEGRDDYEAIRYRGKCLIRKARCYVHEGRLGDARHHLADAKAVVKALPNDMQASIKAKLNAVRIDYYRIREDSDKVYSLAWENWQLSYTSTSSHRFGRAIAHTQMAWASLFRGECLRSWRHAMHARQLLISRGLREYWWIAEAERLAALAAAWMLARRNATAIFTPWIEEIQPERDAAKRIVREEIPRQRRHLESLARQLRYSIPWRAAELWSACGQMLAYSGVDESAGEQYLNNALVISREHKYWVVEMYVHEALATLTEDRKACMDHLVESMVIAKRLGLEDTARRRKNREAIRYLEQMYAAEVDD